MLYFELLINKKQQHSETLMNKASQRFYFFVSLLIVFVFRSINVSYLHCYTFKILQW